NTSTHSSLSPHGGTPQPHGGTPQPHGGTPQPHGGTPQPHGGTPQPHGGTPQPHGGTPQPHGGTPQPHGGTPQSTSKMKKVSLRALRPHNIPGFYGRKLAQGYNPVWLVYMHETHLLHKHETRGGSESYRMVFAEFKPGNTDVNLRGVDCSKCGADKYLGLIINVAKKTSRENLSEP
uniref:Uncharacterized protein n=1 Tax=Neogobius melanostomus TaxID=47308 RepID=A0A8C6UHV0_9GOBI